MNSNPMNQCRNAHPPGLLYGTKYIQNNKHPPLNISAANVSFNQIEVKNERIYIIVHVFSKENKKSVTSEDGRSKVKRGSK